MYYGGKINLMYLVYYFSKRRVLQPSVLSKVRSLFSLLGKFRLFFSILRLGRLWYRPYKRDVFQRNSKKRSHNNLKTTFMFILDTHFVFLFIIITWQEINIGTRKEKF